MLSFIACALAVKGFSFAPTLAFERHIGPGGYVPVVQNIGDDDWSGKTNGEVGFRSNVPYQTADDTHTNHLYVIFFRDTDYYSWKNQVAEAGEWTINLGYKLAYIEIALPPRPTATQRVPPPYYKVDDFSVPSSKWNKDPYTAVAVAVTWYWNGSKWIEQINYGPTPN